MNAETAGPRCEFFTAPAWPGRDRGGSKRAPTERVHSSAATELNAHSMPIPTYYYYYVCIYVRNKMRQSSHVVLYRTYYYKLTRGCVAHCYVNFLSGLKKKKYGI